MRLRACLAIVLLLGCRDRPGEQPPVPAPAAAVPAAPAAAVPAAPVAVTPATFDLRRCLGQDSALRYSSVSMDSEETGDLSGDEVTLVHTDSGWRATGGLAGGGPPQHAPVRELVVAADSQADDARFRAALVQVPDSVRLDWVIEGRVSCDSIWGTNTLRGGQNGAPTPAILRRVRRGPAEPSDAAHTGMARTVTQVVQSAVAR